MIALCRPAQERDGPISDLASLLRYATFAMDATPINLDSATPLDELSAGAGAEATDVTSLRWAALHDAAAVVATLAGFPDVAAGGRPGSVPAVLSPAPPWRRAVAEQGVADLAALKEPGLAALITVHTGGGDARAAARALWQEFVTARDALMALALPKD
jgi:hypothetical protein